MEEQYHALDLPSKLKPYEKVQSVSVRMLKGKDEKFLGELSIENFDKKYTLLLNQILIGIDPKELTLGDRTYIALWLAMNCYSHIYPIKTHCMNCFNEVEINVDLRLLNKIELPESYKEPFPVTLLDGRIIPMRLLRVKDQIAYLDYVKNKKEEDRNYLLALTICDGSGIGERMEFLNELDSKNLALLKAFHDTNIHGIDLEEYKFDCPKCKEAGITPVPFRFEMLFPSSETVAKVARNTI